MRLETRNETHVLIWLARWLALTWNESCRQRRGRFLVALLIKRLREVHLDGGLIETGNCLKIFQDLHRGQKTLRHRLFRNVEQFGLSQLRHFSEEEGVLEVDNVHTS